MCMIATVGGDIRKINSHWTHERYYRPHRHVSASFLRYLVRVYTYNEFLFNLIGFLSQKWVKDLILELLLSLDPWNAHEKIMIRNFIHKEKKGAYEIPRNLIPEELISYYRQSWLWCLGWMPVLLIWLWALLFSILTCLKCSANLYIPWGVWCLTILYISHST